MPMCGLQEQMAQKAEIDLSFSDREPDVIIENPPKLALYDKFLLLVKTIVEYLFGCYFGFVAGQLCGLLVGNIYVQHFEPLYVKDLKRISVWQLKPYEFASVGAFIGILTGAIIITIINQKLQKPKSIKT